jgi:hypothetical protein
MHPRVRSRRVIRVCLQEQHSLNFHDSWQWHAAGHRGQCQRHAGGSGGSLIDVDLPLCCLTVLRGRVYGLMTAPVYKCLSKATSGLQWLIVGRSSAVGGGTATLDQGGDHWVALR